MNADDYIIQRSKIIPDLIIIKPPVFNDLRGNLYTAYNYEGYKEYLPEDLNFIHDKFAESKQNVLRGLHGDSKTWKLVSCVWGELYEVVVDMRPESPTYKKWDAFNLSSSDYIQILIPPMFINGYYVKSKEAVFHYKLAYNGEYFDVKDQMTYIWNDPMFGIDWPCKNPFLQERDMLSN